MVRILAAASPLRADIDLTDEQLQAVDQLLEFRKSEQTLGGYAGTGKTTVIKTLAKQLPRFEFCAYTGKAANVLRRKGIPATTIHGQIYMPVEVERKDANGRTKRVVEFVLKPEVLCDGFVVDEASMVNEAIYRDLLSFNLPIIFVGDHGQLEPVSGGDFNLMEAPDIVLEQVHRNAGEIAQFANFIRKGNTPALWERHELYSGRDVRFLRLKDLDVMPDQIICAYNRTRIAVNKVVRDLNGYPEGSPVVGDRVMCLENSARLKIFNGMQGVIEALNGNEMVFAAEGRSTPVRFIPNRFNSEAKTHERRRDAIPFDYSYAITCHKAQGDEWDAVLVIEERCAGWSHARWAYTAASRARKQLLWAAC